VRFFGAITETTQSTPGRSVRSSSVMAVTTDPAGTSIGDALRHRRLGLDLPTGWWPTTPRLKGWEAAGFGLVQITIAGRELLRDRGLLGAHAAALRAGLGLTGMGLVLHAPSDLVPGARRDDALLGGALRYAEVAGAELLVVHGGRVDGAARSLRRLARRAHDTVVRIAVENAAPRYPGHDCASHDPAVIAELVRRVGCEEVGMCLDIGHAYIAADRLGGDLAELIAPLLDEVMLFGIHDNFGARSRRRSPLWCASSSASERLMSWGNVIDGAFGAIRFGHLASDRHAQGVLISRQCALGCPRSWRSAEAGSRWSGETPCSTTTCLG
jgi:sugar phosphate isomerase/epimerase